MSNAVQLLAEIRQSSERRPFEVLKLAEPLLGSGGGLGTGADAWLAYEQVFVAAIDDGEMELARAVLGRLHKRFGAGSQRVKRLAGMFNEAAGHAAEAKRMYGEMLAADETNVLASKRLIAMLKAQGQLGEATAQLVAYLDTHGNDFEAWLELSALYLRQQLYPQAAFCVEEAILQQPANHYFHLCYAEINYTMGALDVALKEFLRVVELSTDNVRGFYGVRLTADRILEAKRRPKKEQPAWADAAPQPATLERLSELATERLLSVYGAAGAAPKRAAEAWLQQS
ncbi:tetratricopeptide repeat domain-containing protein [Coemansia javaensis]|uniref:ER membrane protein complex subunit 2 n=1 Tax=Coemansia javaensis TaxID=2761396 RepID=A0A9W8HGB5_9FUNG|nr:tetratricopeptide repeat domain-containing protein [Coemansia javaensis]